MLHSSSRIFALAIMCERFKIFPNLSPKKKCFRAERYEEGSLVELSHEHVSSHRISQDAEMATPRALIDKLEEWNGLFILHSRLNSRPGGPDVYPGFTSHVPYPEEGVIRRYFRSGGTTAWSDSVVSAGNFRRSEEESGRA